MSLANASAGVVLVAITGQGKTRGKAAVLSIGATINQHLAYIEIRQPTVIPEFLQAMLTSAYTYLRSISDDSGSTKGALTCADLRHFKLAIPPKKEQVRILEKLKAQLAIAKQAINGAEEEISLLREYHTRLIADVVTGKLDVREAAAQLPQEDETPATLDTLIDEADSEEEPDELEALED